jgi:hypothetical protein
MFGRDGGGDPQEGAEQAALAALQEAVRDTDEAEARLQASRAADSVL